MTKFYKTINGNLGPTGGIDKPTPDPDDPGDPCLKCRSIGYKTEAITILGGPRMQGYACDNGHHWYRVIGPAS